jgi:hypothetical protein
MWDIFSVSMIVGLYVVAALLPIAGLLRLAIGTYKSVEEASSEIQKHADNRKNFIHIRGRDGGTMISAADFVGGLNKASSRPVREWQKVKLDLWLVSSGLVCGTVASVWSLFI